MRSPRTQAPIRSANPSPNHVSNESSATLGGRALLLARAAWMGVALAVVALNVLAIPGLYAAQVDPATLRDLRSIGISPALFAAFGFAEVVVLQLVNLALALVLFWRRSHDRMALFGALMFVAFGGVAASPLDDITGGPSPLPNVVAVHVAARVLVVVGQVAFVTFWYIFPSGRFVPRWTRWCLMPALVFWIAAAIQPGIMATPAGNLVIAFIATGLVAQVYRYRNVSTASEREQTKWVLYGLSVAVLIVALPQLVQPFLPQSVLQSGHEHPALDTLTFGQTWIIAVLLIPICIATAILRYRLWEIDLIIRRTFIYGTLTAVLAALYFGAVVGLQVLAGTVDPQASHSPVIIVATTLLIVVLFTPLRRRIQRTIDRRFYRSKYDAARTVEAFAATLRIETDLDGLRERLVAVVDETMRPAHVSLWLPTPIVPRRAFTGGALFSNAHEEAQR